jgi:KDO2-lipid IV(A) lauroyltransferase
MTNEPLPEGPSRVGIQNAAAAGFLIAKGMAKVLPQALRYRLAKGLGALVGRLMTGTRRQVQANLKVLLDADAPDLEKKTDELFENFALTMCDFMNPRGVTYDVEGFEYLDKTVSAGEGVIFITFHIGHWDLGAHILCDRGWKLTVIYQSYASSFLQKVIQAGRPETLRYLPVGQGAAFGAISALSKGEGVAVIGDKTFGEEGEPQALLRGTVLWPKGPYVLAARAAQWVVTGVVARMAPGHYKIFLEKPIRVPQGPVAQVAADLSDQVAGRFGHALRTYPTQWYRFERFWLEKPSPNTLKT